MTTIETTPEHLEQFERDGHFLIEGLFSDDECDDILGHLERTSFELALGQPDEGPLSYRPMMHLASDELRDVATDLRWGPIVLPLLGDSARLYWEQGVAKPPQARTVLPWHQDNGYAPTIPERYVTCWLALDDADVDNGCLWVIPGSHHNGTSRHYDVEGSPFRAGYDGPDTGVAVPVRRGSVLVFSSLVMHQSGPNVTDRQRRAWILQYCEGDTVHARTKELLDDRLLVAENGQWLDEPIQQRPVDIKAIIRGYERG